MGAPSEVRPPQSALPKAIPQVSESVPTSPAVDSQPPSPAVRTGEPCIALGSSTVGVLESNKGTPPASRTPSSESTVGNSPGLIHEELGSSEIAEASALPPAGRFLPYSRLWTPPPMSPTPGAAKD